MTFALTPEQRDGIQLVGGNSHPELAALTAMQIQVGDEDAYLELDDVELKTFPNSEQYVRYERSVRGKHVFIIQSMVASEFQSVDNSLVQTALLIDAAKRGSASEVTLIAPLMAYGRQDRKTKGRDPISGAWAIDMLINSGADRIVSLDMHSAQLQGVTKKPFDHLTGAELISHALGSNIIDDPRAFVIVSPDSGRAKASEQYGETLGVEVAHLPKLRDHEDSSKIHRPKLIEQIDGRTCIVIDDMIDTAGTLVSAARALKDAGARGVIAAATHGIFSGNALERLQDSVIDRLLVTDTVPQRTTVNALGEKVEVLSVAPLLAQAVVEITMKGSISDMFHGRNYS